MPEAEAVFAIVAATFVAVDTAEVDVGFLSHLDGTLVLSVVAACFWAFLPPADMEVADEMHATDGVGAFFLAACVGQELVPVVEEAIC